MMKPMVRSGPPSTAAFAGAIAAWALSAKRQMTVVESKSAACCHCQSAGAEAQAQPRQPAGAQPAAIEAPLEERGIGPSPGEPQTEEIRRGGGPTRYGAAR